MSAGVDACRAGYVACLLDGPDLELRLCSTFPEVLALPAATVVVDIGLALRQDLLDRLGLRTPARSPLRGAGLDDVLDARVLALVAGSIAAATSRRVPAAPTRDRRGLVMAIWH